MRLSSSKFFLAVVAAAFCIVTSFAWTPVHAQERPHIARAQIDSMFSAMRANAPWNVDGPLLWGYYFSAPTSEKLDQIASELESKGYRVVGITMPQGKPRLQVEKVETHTPASLDARNQEFYTLAGRNGISYNGMDVGPVQVQEVK
jgi:hypothetical protein